MVLIPLEASLVYFYPSDSRDAHRELSNENHELLCY